MIYIVYIYIINVFLNVMIMDKLQQKLYNNRVKYMNKFKYVCDFLNEFLKE